MQKSGSGPVKARALKCLYSELVAKVALWDGERMTEFISRRCRVVGKDVEILGLDELRGEDAYILLGEAGAGKSTAFKREAEVENGIYISAQDFITFGAEQSVEGKTLFIDALDEVRASNANAKTPLEAVRKRLVELGRPKFRISCREADWQGEADKAALTKVSPNGGLRIAHLEPLSREEVLGFLEGRTANPLQFYATASQRGLADLLTNPQTLKLMLKAVEDGDWPNSRLETYDLACKKLLMEVNPEHSRALQGKRPSVEKMETLAGFIFASLLLSGKQGVTLNANGLQEGYTFFENFVIGTPQEIGALLRTNIFKAEQEEHFTYVHKTIAEYLAAKELSKRIESGQCSLERVLSLLTGQDGGIVAELRGMAGWLAAHSKAAREVLIHRDPLAVVLYGDAQDFPLPTRKEIFRSFKNKAERYAWIRQESWTAYPWGAIASADLKDFFLEVIKSSDRSDAHQALLDAVLEAILSSNCIDGMELELETIVRGSFWGRIRSSALEILIRNSSAQESLLKILQDVWEGRVGDEDDELLGHILQQLTPSVITPVKALSYLRRQKNEDLLGNYVWFWHQLGTNIPDEMLPEFLDELATKRLLHQVGLFENHIQKMVGTALARTLEKFGDSNPPSRIATWLDAGLDEYASAVIEQSEQNRVAAWLASRPELCKELLKIQIARMSTLKGRGVFLEDKLYGARLPADAWRFFLEEAALASDPEIGKSLFIRALSEYTEKSCWDQAPLEEIEYWVNKHPQFAKEYADFIVSDISTYRLKHALNKAQKRKEQQQREVDIQNHFKGVLESLKTERAHVSVMQDLARIYMGQMSGQVGDTPEKRISSWIGVEESSAQLVVDAIKDTVDREREIPPYHEILSKALNGTLFRIQTPFLLGLELRHESGDIHHSDLGDEILKSAIAFHFCSHNEKAPMWLCEVIEDSPGLVSEVVLELVILSIKSQSEYIPTFDFFRRSTYLEPILRACLRDALAALPEKVSRKRLGELSALLVLAARMLSQQDFQGLTNSRLANPNVDIVQKLYFSLAAVCAGIQAFNSQCISLLGESKVRARFLADFLTHVEERAIPEELSENLISTIIQALGAFTSPDRSASGTVTSAMRRADVCRALIRSLGDRPTEEARKEFESLTGNPLLAAWNFHLTQARYNQEITARQSRFTYEPIEQVQATLQDGNPANCADLIAIVKDIVIEIGRKLRDGNTDGYKQYWNVDSYGRPIKPRPEESCRDSLLTMLEEKLKKFAIDAIPEAHYADDKRSDIRVSFGTRFHIPLEIKKDGHSEIWTALHDQLIKLYVRDPGSHGYGIYLVLWFGEISIASPKTGNIPKSPEELKAELERLLSDEEQQRILVLVIDLSKNS